MKDTAALIVAAGAGTRFGGGVPKVFLPLAGEPLFLWSVRACDACPDVQRLLVAAAPPHLDRAEALLAGAALSKPWSLVAGGQQRQDTVFNGLMKLEAEGAPEVIAIQDGARPLTDPQTISGSISLARDKGACVTAAPVTDTIKQVDADGAIAATPDRSLLYRAQTPQTFNFGLLIDCYRRALERGWQVTDDASVVERCGHPVFINQGSPSNIKVTTPEDMAHAAALVSRGKVSEGADAAMRIGHGYDVHALVTGRRLVIGGVEIPHELGLAGHSDADVLLHAICDALLGAAAAGDIGHLFPDTDPAYEGADSLELTGRVADRIDAIGFAVGNVDATVVAQRPKLAPHIPAMRANIAAALGVDVDRVSVKATTTEKLGFEGREEGISAHAVASLLPAP